MHSNPFRRHRDGFVEIGGEYPGCEEARAVPHDHRPLAGAADKRQGMTDNGVSGLGTYCDLDQRHSFGGRKEMQPEKARRVDQSPRQSADRQSRRVAGEDRLGRGLLDICQDDGLEAPIFRHAFDHKVTVPQATKHRSRFDIREDGGLDGGVEPAAGDLTGQRRCQNLESAPRGVFVAPGENDRGARGGESLRYPEPHQAGTDDADARASVTYGIGVRHRAKRVRRAQY